MKKSAMILATAFTLAVGSSFAADMTNDKISHSGMAQHSMSMDKTGSMKHRIKPLKKNMTKTKYSMKKRGKMKMMKKNGKNAFDAAHVTLKKQEAVKQTASCFGVYYADRRLVASGKY
ncbi:hypothetical protein [Neisseria chenwenguii]|uniref:Uncharacterized protein n=1 Tax=Neisseria chenwenguii TaxID=1853278 RepID=A0A220S3G8_9NEIS|nr:hypothetical protein [Neisseria chenwenguii]ASK28049.1 hypothetical protein BG910_10185 [Neisseria chenwenguii]ROV57200.1 hypothetical protein EGS38_00445 [Neisseria chenwenguii]